MDISFIIPVYNTEAYLPDCLDSILHNQILERVDFEVILVNDGSTDASLQVMEKWAAAYPFVKAYSKENGGASSARNFGLTQASGNYIQFVDSDDYLNDQVDFDLASLIRLDKYDGIFFDARIDEKHANESKFSYQRQQAYGDYDQAYAFLAALKKNNEYSASPCLYLFKRELAEHASLYFIEGIENEDEHFTLVAMMLMGETFHQNIPYYVRRVREGSVMAKQDFNRKVHNFLQVMAHLERFFQAFPFKSPKQERTFLRAFDDIYYYSLRSYYEADQQNPSDLKQMLAIGERHHYFSTKSRLLSKFPAFYLGLLRRLKS